MISPHYTHAQQQELASQQYAQGMRNPEAPPPPMLIIDAAMHEIRASNDRLADVLQRMLALQERIFGPVPSSGETERLQNTASGKAGILAVLLQDQSKGISAISAVLAELERLA